MFDYLLLKRKNLRLERENERLSMELDEERKLTTTLFAEISRRDKKIAELIQQKGSKNPDPLNFEFPGTEKHFDDFWAKFYCPKNKES